MESRFGGGIGVAVDGNLKVLICGINSIRHPQFKIQSKNDEAGFLDARIVAILETIALSSQRETSG